MKRVKIVAIPQQLGGYQSPVTPQERLGYNRYRDALVSGPGQYVRDWNHNEDYQKQVAQQQGWDYNRNAAIQNDMQSGTHAITGATGSDPWGGNANWLGSREKNKSYRQYQYEHANAQGQLYPGAQGFQDTGTEPMSSSQMSAWLQPKSQWMSNSQGNQMASSMPATPSLKEYTSPNPERQRQQGNWHTGENTDYSIDSIRSAKFGGMMQSGGKVKPPKQATTQDSLDVYNNAKKVKDFYENSGRYSITGAWEYPISSFDRENSEAYTRYIQEGAEHMTPSGIRKLNSEDYRKDIDNNKYYQRERESKTLNMDAPMSLYDRRIIPQKSTLLNYNNKPNDPLNNDLVNLYQYDPIAVKPYKLLTQEEKKVRDRKYPQPIVSSAPIPQSGTGDYKAIELYPEHHIYNYPTQQQADSAANSIANKVYQQGGQVNNNYMKRKVRIIGVLMTGIGTQGPAATPDATMMSLGGTTYVPGGEDRYASQQKGHGYALNRFWNSPAGYPGATSKVNPFERVGTTLPEAIDGGDINAEKNERVLGDFDQDGNMELMNVGGPSHAQGGKDVNVPSNSFVFSDTKDLKIKDPAILAQFGMSYKRGGFTPADIAKKYDLNNYKKVTSDPNADDYSLKTAQLMSDNYLAKLSKLAQVQEEMKKSMGMEHSADGISKHMYQAGGPTRPTTPEEWTDFTRNQIAYPKEFSSYPPQIPPAHGSDWMPFDAARAAQEGYTGEHSTEGYQKWANLHGANLKVDNKMGEKTTGWKNPDGPIEPLPIAGPSQIPAPSNDNDPYYNLVPYAPSSSPVSTPISPEFPTAKNKVDVPGNTDHKWNIGMDPNFYGNLQNVLGIANLRKFQPYEPVPQTVIPDTVFLDPTRAIAAQQEEARSGSEMDAVSTNPQVARAMGLARQGIAGKQAADTIGQYHNQNVGIANSANQQAAQITNQLYEKQANRLSELNKANFLSDRDYQKQMSTLQEEYTLRQQQEHNADVNRQRYNKWNPYFTMDRSGYYQLKPGVTEAKLQEMYNGNKGGAGTMVEKEAAAAKYAQSLITQYPGLTMAEAAKWARQEYGLMGRESEIFKPGAVMPTTRYSGMPVGGGMGTGEGYPGEYPQPSVPSTPYRTGGPLMKMGGKTTDLYSNTKLKKFLK